MKSRPEFESMLYTELTSYLFNANTVKYGEEKCCRWKNVSREVYPQKTKSVKFGDNSKSNFTNVLHIIDS